MTVRIRVLEPREIDARAPELVALAVRSKASWGYDPGFLAAFEQAMVDDLGEVTRPMGDAPRAGARPASVVIVAEEAGAPGIAGFAQVRDEGDRAWLEDLWVDADRLRSGVGRLLWDAALAIAHEMGRSVLELESDPNAEPFYVRMGAHRIGVRPSSIEEGRRLPLMRITLGAPTA